MDRSRSYLSSTQSAPSNTALFTDVQPEAFIDQEQTNQVREAPPLIDKYREGNERSTVLDEDAERRQQAFVRQLEEVRIRARALSDYSARLYQDSSQPSASTSSAEPLDSSDNSRDNSINDGHLLAKGKGPIESLMGFALDVIRQPDVFVKHYSNFAHEMLRIIQSESTLKPVRGDRRFRDLVWKENFIYHTVLQTYLAWNNELKGLISDMDMGQDDRKRSHFLLEQIASAIAPSNSILNPVAIKRAYQTGGHSMLDGMKNFLHDVAHNQGMPQKVRSDAFEVGVDLALSDGAVIFRCELFELIQYSPVNTSQVYTRPAFIIPPQINKFYIFDLTPKTSLVRHLLERGIQVFIVSWKNPTKTNAHWGLDNYIEHLEQGINAALDIADCESLNIVSACAGGITSLSLQGYFSAINKPGINSHTMLVTALNAEDHPTLGLFMTKEAIDRTLARTKKNGVMDGKELAHIFSWLRPTELVWNYWINNYLLGKEPPAMDVLFWDNDSTRLPAALHRDFMDIYLNDRFSDRNELVVREKKVDIKNLTTDFYFVGGDEDYLMPWKNCYKNVGMLNAKCEFVLSNSGHIQSVLRPPGIANTSYYTNSQKCHHPDDWLSNADKVDGSWWDHWTDWLSNRAGTHKPAPGQLGNKRYPPLCPAPGEYVLDK